MCKTKIPLTFDEGPPQIIGTLIGFRVKTNWNRTVRPRAVSQEGAVVTLSERALEQINNAYNGKPLKVSFSKPCCDKCDLCTACCFCCKCCGICGCDCDCDCIPTLNFPVVAAKIWYGDRDDEPRISPLPACFLNALCFGIPYCVGWNCFIHRISIDHREVSYDYLMEL